MIDEIKKHTIIHAGYKSNTETSCFLNSKKAVIAKDSEVKKKAPPVIKGDIMSPSKESLLKKNAIQKDESLSIEVKKNN